MDHDFLMLLLSAHQPRRLKVIQNTLANRRTVSTLFWGMRYQMIDFLGVAKHIDPTWLASQFQQLESAGLVYQPVGEQVMLTPAGLTRVHTLKAALCGPLALPNNRTLSLVRFRQRFLLATQLMSEYSYRNRRYYPMLGDPAEAQVVKRWFHRFKDLGLSQFQDGLRAFLVTVPAASAWQFASQLNGHATTGLTLIQQADRLHLPVGILAMNELLLFDHLATFIEAHKTQLTSWAALMAGLERSLISASSQATVRAFYNHASFQQIAAQRGIKPSTVKEHLLEVAILAPRFPFSATDFYDERTLGQLATIYHGNVDDWTYDRMHAQLPQLDYFYFRMYQILRSRVHNEK